jgi:hypothetical protein
MPLPTPEALRQSHGAARCGVEFEDRLSILGALLVIANLPKVFGGKCIQTRRNLFHAKFVVALDGEPGGAQTFLGVREGDVEQLRIAAHDLLGHPLEGPLLLLSLPLEGLPLLLGLKLTDTNQSSTMIESQVGSGMPMSKVTMVLALLTILEIAHYLSNASPEARGVGVGVGMGSGVGVLEGYGWSSLFHLTTRRRPADYFHNQDRRGQLTRPHRYLVRPRMLLE